MYLSSFCLTQKTKYANVNDSFIVAISETQIMIEQNSLKTCIYLIPATCYSSAIYPDAVRVIGFCMRSGNSEMDYSENILRKTHGKCPETEVVLLSWKTSIGGSQTSVTLLYISILMIFIYINTVHTNLCGRYIYWLITTNSSK